MYRVVVKGRIARAAFDNIDGFELDYVDGSESAFVGAAADQADLYGLLLYLQRLGIELVSVSKVQG